MNDLTAHTTVPGSPVALEICCYSVADALAAQQAGADRIELCASPADSGITPSIGIIECVLAAVDIPVFVMIRPRGGDFVFDRYERDAMRRDLAEAVDRGVPGVVIGALTEGHDVDTQLCAELIDIARSGNESINITFHKAFDETVDPFHALDVLHNLGVDRVLTSGQAPTAIEGLPLLTELIATSSRGDLQIMPGGGVRPHNAEVLLELGVLDLHSAATFDGGSGVDPRIVSKLAAIVHR